MYLFIYQSEKDARDDSPSPRNESSHNEYEDDHEEPLEDDLDEASEASEDDVKIEPKTEDGLGLGLSSPEANTNPFLNFNNSQDIFVVIWETHFGCYLV